MKIKSGSNRNFSAQSVNPDGTFPIIVRGTSEWDEWMEYFAHTGNPHGHPNSYARKVGRMTVRAKFPEMIDPSWREREPVAFSQGTYPPNPSYIPSTGKPRDPWEAERQREAIAGMLAKLKEELGTSKRHGARDRRDAEAEKRKAQEWLANYSAGESQPVTVSPRLAGLIESMVPPKKDEAAE